MRVIPHSARSRPGGYDGSSPPGAVCWLPSTLNVIDRIATGGPVLAEVGTVGRAARSCAATPAGPSLSRVRCSAGAIRAARRADAADVPVGEVAALRKAPAGAAEALEAIDGSPQHHRWAFASRP